jgi:hypothetical protein
MFALRRFVTLTALATLVFTTGCAAFSPEGRLDQVAGQVQRALDKLDNDLAQTTPKLTDVALDSDAARDAVTGVYRRNQSATYVGTVSPDGTLMAVAPRRHADREGRDVGGRESITRTKVTQQPAFSNVFDSMGGYAAVFLAHPIMAGPSDYRGTLALQLRPDDFLRAIVKAPTDFTDHQVWVLQSNGTVLYHAADDVIGTNVFRDQLFYDHPETVAFIGQVTENDAGQGEFAFRTAPDDATEQTYDAVWRTVSLHGTTWRILVATPRDEAN